MEEGVINVMGEEVLPAPIEAFLRLHPAIAEAAVIGVPDAHLGQTVKAFVTLKPGGQATPKEIIAFCKERLPRHQYPRQVEVLEVLPKDEAGSILRRELRARESARLRGQPLPPIERP
jgi:long-chain acyl-CoA synthetase